MVAKGPEREDKATRGHKYDRNTAPHRGTSSFCSSTAPEVPKTPRRPHLQKVHPQLSPTFSWWPKTPPGRAACGELGAPGQAVRCGSCKEPSGHGQGTCPTSFCPFLFPPPEPPSGRQELPSPLLQPPPLSLRLFHQTKHHLSGKQLQKQLCWNRCPRVPQSLSHPPSRSATHLHTHTCVPATCLLCCPQCWTWGTEPCFQSCIPASNPMNTLGLQCGRRSRSQHLGCPVTPPTPGVADRCC